MLGSTVCITDGTEVGHSQGHTDGVKLDIRATDCITSYIESYFTSAGTRGDGARLYQDSLGSIFVNESGIHPDRPHWDIAFHC